MGVLLLEIVEKHDHCTRLLVCAELAELVFSAYKLANDLGANGVGNGRYRQNAVKVFDPLTEDADVDEARCGDLDRVTEGDGRLIHVIGFNEILAQKPGTR